jgi:hypothetical protein
LSLRHVNIFVISIKLLIFLTSIWPIFKGKKIPFHKAIFPNFVGLNLHAEKISQVLRNIFSKVLLDIVSLSKTACNFRIWKFYNSYLLAKSKLGHKKYPFERLSFKGTAQQ